MGFPGSVRVNPPASAGDIRGKILIPGLGRSPGGGKGNPLLFLPGEFHKQRRLMGYRPWGHKELNWTPFSSVQSPTCVRLFATPWTAARQASLSITNSQSLLKLMAIEFVMPSNHLILCHPLLLPPSIFLSIRVVSDESVLRIRRPKYWGFSFSTNHSNEYSGLFPLGQTG